MRVSFRINENKDKDIYEALENVADTTREVKRLIRRGLMYTPPTTIEKVIKEFSGYSFEENDDLEDREPIVERKKKPVDNVMPDQIHINTEESPDPHEEDITTHEESTGEHQTEEYKTEEIEVDEDALVNNFLKNF